MFKVYTLDEAYSEIGICKEDRMYDFQGSYQSLLDWAENNDYIVVHNSSSKDNGVYAQGERK